MNWVNAEFNMNVSDLVLDEVSNSSLPWVIEIAVTSNREIYRKDGGHFSFRITGSDKVVGDFSAITPCVEVGAAASDVIKLVGATLYEGTDNTTEPMPLSALLDVAVKRYGDGKIVSDFATTYRASFSSQSVYTLAVEVTQEDCVPLQTFGYWNDGRNWEEGSAPYARDSVYFPADSGIVELTEDVTVQSLNMLGGTLILQSSGCNDGWSLGPEGRSQE